MMQRAQGFAHPFVTTHAGRKCRVQTDISEPATARHYHALAVMPKPALIATIVMIRMATKPSVEWSGSSVRPQFACHAQAWLASQAPSTRFHRNKDGNSAGVSGLGLTHQIGIEGRRLAEAHESKDAIHISVGFVPLSYIATIE